jgi:hypothetical protein
VPISKLSPATSQPITPDSRPKGPEAPPSGSVREADAQGGNAGWNPLISAGAAATKAAAYLNEAARGVHASKVENAIYYGLDTLTADHVMPRISNLPAKTLASLEGAKPAITKIMQTARDSYVRTNAERLANAAIASAKEDIPKALALAGKMGSKLVPVLNLGAVAMAGVQVNNIESDPKSTTVDKWLARTSLGLAVGAAGTSAFSGTALAGTLAVPFAAPATLTAAALAESASFTMGVAGMVVDGALIAKRFLE